MKTLVTLTTMLALQTPVQAAQLSINELFVLAQKYPVLAQAYVAGVLDASKDAAWCNPQDPDPELVLQAAIKYALKNNIDPNKPADYAVVPLMQQLAPCKNDNI